MDAGSVRWDDELSPMREKTQLQGAPQSPVVVSRAVGVLMERCRLSADEAFAVLRRAARNGKRPIHDLAREITETPEGETAPIVTSARPAPLTEAKGMIAFARTTRLQAVALRENASTLRLMAARLSSYTLRIRGGRSKPIETRPRVVCQFGA